MLLATFPHFHVLSSLAKAKCFQSQLYFFAPTFDDFKSLISDYVPFTWPFLIDLSIYNSNQKQLSLLLI